MTTDELIVKLDALIVEHEERAKIFKKRTDWEKAFEHEGKAAGYSHSRALVLRFLKDNEE